MPGCAGDNAFHQRQEQGGFPAQQQPGAALPCCPAVSCGRHSAPRLASPAELTFKSIASCLHAQEEVTCVARA